MKKETNDIGKWRHKISFYIKKNKLIKGRILRDIRNIIQHEEENYLKPVKTLVFAIPIIMNVEVKVMQIKHYQLKNILKSLWHI